MFTYKFRLSTAIGCMGWPPSVVMPATMESGSAVGTRPVAGQGDAAVSLSGPTYSLFPPIAIPVPPLLPRLTRAAEALNHVGSAVLVGIPQSHHVATGRG